MSDERAPQLSDKQLPPLPRKAPRPFPHPTPSFSPPLRLPWVSRPHALFETVLSAMGASMRPAALAALLLSLCATLAMSQTTTTADANATTAEATTTTTTTTTLGCRALPRVEHATAQAAAGGLLPGQSAVYACNTGYATPQGAAQWTLTCDLTGALSEIVPCVGTGGGRGRGRGRRWEREGGKGKERGERRKRRV